jgi:hypothetical protein
MNDLTKILFVQPLSGPAIDSRNVSCLQLTDRRVYFTWDDAKRRRDIPLFKDEKTGLDLLSPEASTSFTVEQLDELQARLDLEFGRFHL